MAKYVDEIILIDDASLDRTAIIAKQAGAIILSHKKNQGYDKSLDDGFVLAAKRGATIILTFDSDGQHNAEDIPKIVEPILKGEADKVTDLADVLAPKARRKITGIRPGEKINEILITEEEVRHAREFDNYFAIEPEHPFWGKDNLQGGKPIPHGFKYTSDSNSWWLTKDELKGMLGEI